MYSNTDTSGSAFTLFLYAFVPVNVSNKCSFLCTCKIMNTKYPFDLILHVHHTLCIPCCCCYIPSSWISFTNSRLGLVARQSNLICLELCSIIHTAKRVQLDASTISYRRVKGALKTTSNKWREEHVQEVTFILISTSSPKPGTSPAA